MASLIGETVSYAIEFESVNGYETLASGSFVVGPTQEVSRSISYTFNSGGFPQTFTGTATINLNASTLEVGFSGTAQPYALDFVLSDLAQGSVQAVTGVTQTASSGTQTGVNAELAPNFTNTTVTTGFSFYGYQTGTNITQTDQLTFGPGSPEISSSSYNAVTGKLVVGGSSFTTSAGNFNTTGLTITGEDGSTYTLSSGSVIAGTPTSTSFTVNLSAADQLAVDGLLNKNGTASSGTDIYAASNGGPTTYVLSAAASFDTGGTAESSGVTVSNALTPTITSVYYNNQTGVLTLNGTGFENDGEYGGINLGQITLKGGNNQTFTFNASDYASVDSTTQASIDLTNTATQQNSQLVMAGEEASVNALFDQTGATSKEGTVYNFAATLGWDSGAGAAITTQPVTVSTSVTVASPPAITSATYNAGTGALVVTGSNLTTNASDFNPSALTIKGQSGISYALTGGTVSGSSSTSFTVTLSSADQLAVDGLLNKNGTAAAGGTTYNIAANASFDTGGSASNGGVAVSAATAPTIGAVAYNAVTGVLTLTGTGFENEGTTGGLALGDFNFTGKGGGAVTLSGTASVASTTSATVTLSSAQRSSLDAIFDANGTGDSTATYNLAVTSGWDAAVGTAMATEAVTVSGYPTTTVASLSFSNDTGTSSTDFVTDAAAQTISGKLRANLAAGETVQVSLDGGATWTSANTEAVGSASWSLSGQTLAASNTLEARVVNSAGGGPVRTQTYVLDQTAPSISSITLDQTAYKLGDTVTATIQLSGASDGNGAYTLGQGSTIDGATLTAETYNAADNTLTASFVVGANTTEVIAGSVATNATVDDAAGNASTADTTAVAGETIDTHAPTTVSVAGFTSGTTDTGNAPVTAGSTVGALSTTDASPNDSFSYALGGTDAGRFAITNGVLDVGTTALTDGTIYDLTVTSTDLGGNQCAQAVQVTGATTPAVTSIVPADASPTNTASDPFTVTFSQAVTGVTASSFTLSGTDGTGTIGAPTTNDGGITYTVPVTGVSGNGTLGLDLTSTTGIVSTSTGTALAGTHASDADYTIDTTLTTPTVALAASNSTVGAADVNAAHAAAAGYTVGTVDSDATATVTFTGTLKSTGTTGTVAGDGMSGSHTVDLSGFRDGIVTASISDRDTAGNTATGQGVQMRLDTTLPIITALSDSGAGIAADGSGDLGAGKTVTFTVTDSEPVYVSGGTPSLTLNDGGTATYTGGSSTNTLTFTTTVAAGQNIAALAVSSVQANGATVTDAAGNPISTSLAGATTPTGALVIDTTPPVASSPTLTVAQNAAATPIGIAAPSDNLTAAGGLVVVAGALPTDGTVTLADGITRVTTGQNLTSVQLTGLEFTPTAGVSNQGSTFAYTVTDGTGNASIGTAALNVGSAGAPTITGTHATATTSEAAVTPFSGVTVADPSAATDTLTIALTGASGTLSGAGLTANANGSYSLTGSAAAVTQSLDALRFTPSAGAAGTTSTTTFVLTDASSSGTSVTDARTSVADTDPAVAPTPVQPTPAPSPTPVAPDAVSIDPAVTYNHGVFTLTGSASSAAGVSSVEISAVLNDGTRQGLGAATLNGDGTFTFADRIGGNQQGFIEATLTDDAGVQAISADPGFSLTGGLDQGQFRARQTTYTDDGMAETAVSLFRAGGSRQVDVLEAGQTLTPDFFDTFDNHGAPSNTFVFDPGHGLDVVRQFRVDGADHDTLSFSGSDFGNSIAEVLRNTTMVNGSAVITDPTSGDAVKLAGITKAELRANRQDFTFHA